MPWDQIAPLQPSERNVDNRCGSLPYENDWPLHADAARRLRRKEIDFDEYNRLFAEASERMRPTEEGPLPERWPLGDGT